jgi:trimeric autotransporter adhesin
VLPKRETDAAQASWRLHHHKLKVAALAALRVHAAGLASVRTSGAPATLAPAPAQPQLDVDALAEAAIAAAATAAASAATAAESSGTDDEQPGISKASRAARPGTAQHGVTEKPRKAQAPRAQPFSRMVGREGAAQKKASKWRNAANAAAVASALATGGDAEVTTTPVGDAPQTAAAVMEGENQEHQELQRAQQQQQQQETTISKTPPPGEICGQQPATDAVGAQLQTLQEACPPLHNSPRASFAGAAASALVSMGQHVGRRVLRSLGSLLGSSVHGGDRYATSAQNVQGTDSHENRAHHPSPTHWWSSSPGGVRGGRGVRDNTSAIAAHDGRAGGSGSPSRHGRLSWWSSLQGGRDQVSAVHTALPDPAAGTGKQNAALSLIDRLWCSLGGGRGRSSPHQAAAPTGAAGVTFQSNAAASHPGTASSVPGPVSGSSGLVHHNECQDGPPAVADDVQLLDLDSWRPCRADAARVPAGEDAGSVGAAPSDNISNITAPPAVRLLVSSAHRTQQEHNCQQQQQQLLLLLTSDAGSSNALSTGVSGRGTSLAGSKPGGTALLLSMSLAGALAAASSMTGGRHVQQQGHEPASTRLQQLVDSASLTRSATETPAAAAGSPTQQHAVDGHAILQSRASLAMGLLFSAQLAADSLRAIGSELAPAPNHPCRLVPPHTSEPCDRLPEPERRGDQQQQQPAGMSALAHALAQGLGHQRLHHTPVWRPYQLLAPNHSGAALPSEDAGLVAEGSRLLPVHQPHTALVESTAPDVADTMMLSHAAAPAPRSLAAVAELCTDPTLAGGHCSLPGRSAGTLARLPQLPARRIGLAQRAGRSEVPSTTAAAAHDDLRPRPAPAQVAVGADGASSKGREQKFGHLAPLEPLQLSSLGQQRPVHVAAQRLTHSAGTGHHARPSAQNLQPDPQLYLGGSSALKQLSSQRAGSAHAALSTAHQEVDSSVSAALQKTTEQAAVARQAEPNSSHSQTMGGGIVVGTALLAASQPLPTGHNVSHGALLPTRGQLGGRQAAQDTVKACHADVTHLVNPQQNIQLMISKPLVKVNALPSPAAGGGVGALSGTSLSLHPSATPLGNNGMQVTHSAAAAAAAAAAPISPQMSAHILPLQAAVVATQQPLQVVASARGVTLGAEGAGMGSPRIPALPPLPGAALHAQHRRKQ